MTKLKISSQNILNIEPYKPGISKVLGKKEPIKLSSNENPFGCSENVLKAINESFKKIHRYPDGSSTLIREKIGEFYKLNPNQVICGAGSDEIITFICMAYGGAGSEVIYTEHGFLMYPISAMATGATPVKVKEKNLKADIEEILKAVTPKTTIVFLANPNNPTGSYLTTEEVRALRKALPQNILLVLDYAYAEYVNRDDYPDAFQLATEFDNIIAIRTFSKVYGIPSIRLGFGYACDEIIDILNRVRGPFNTSTMAQVAGVAALEDQKFVKKTVEHNTKWLKIVTEELAAIGYRIYPSVGNFFLMDFETEKRADSADLFLKECGIIGRQMQAYGLPSCMRFTIGLEEENKLLLKSLKEFKHG
jgi:histidinol-phosphate aminotransferase